jgi:hypothetical protein
MVGATKVIRRVSAQSLNQTELSEEIKKDQRESKRTGADAVSYRKPNDCCQKQKAQPAFALEETTPPANNRRRYCLLQSLTMWSPLRKSSPAKARSHWPKREFEEPGKDRRNISGKPAKDARQRQQELNAIGPHGEKCEK